MLKRSYLILITTVIIMLSSCCPEGNYIPLPRDNAIDMLKNDTLIFKSEFNTDTFFVSDVVIFDNIAYDDQKGLICKERTYYEIRLYVIKNIIDSLYKDFNFSQSSELPENNYFDNFYWESPSDTLYSLSYLSDGMLLSSIDTIILGDSLPDRIYFDYTEGLKWYRYTTNEQYDFERLIRYDQ